MLTNSVVRPSARAKSSAISTSKPTRRSGRDGSASTNGAPPSGSPAQRRTRGCAATWTPETESAAAMAREAMIARRDTGVDSTGRSAMATVAFLGTGLLGSGMVEGMLRRGDAVTVWNRTTAKARALEPLGAKIAATPPDAVAGADHVHMTLPDDAVVDEISAAIAPRLKPGAIVVDHSTTSPPGAKARIEQARAANVRFLHAPVFMSPQMARDGVGVMLVSGPQEAFEAVRDRLEKMTGEVWYLGERGDLAAAYKIFGNSMLFVIAAGVTDVFAMAKGLGIAPGEALAVFTKFQPGGIIKSRGEKMARGDFSASFELTMARKDMRLMLEAAAGQPMAVLPAIAKAMDDAIAKGRGHEDLGAIAAEVIR